MKLNFAHFHDRIGGWLFSKRELPPKLMKREDIDTWGAVSRFGETGSIEVPDDLFCAPVYFGWASKELIQDEEQDKIFFLGSYEEHALTNDAEILKRMEGDDPPEVRLDVWHIG